MTMKQLVVEGWRASSHSYALVNQHQLLHLVGDLRFRVYHVDVPLLREHWAQVAAGFSQQDEAALRSLGPPSGRADVVYRISWPLRSYPSGGARVFVFGTCEIGYLPSKHLCGPNGDAAGIDLEAVEFVTPSSWSRRGMIASGISEHRVHLIPHGIDPALGQVRSDHDRAQVRQSLEIPQDAFVFLSIGAMTWNKGIGPLLAAFARHRARYPQSVLVLKGTDALYGNTLAAALADACRIYPDLRPQSLAPAVRYLPHNLSQRSLADLYHASDAYVSAYRAEGFNLPVLEAMASGLPVIVTAGGATDDFCAGTPALQIEASMCREGIRVHLEPSLDSVVEHMQRAVETAAELRAAARAVVPDVIERCSWRAVTARLANLLNG